MAKPEKAITRGPRTKATVSTRARLTFLRHFAETGNVTLSAKLAGISRQRPYEWRQQSERFAKAWDQAGEEATDALEGEARRRATEGWDEPVYQQGRLVGHIKRYSDKLLELLLRANRDKYRQGMAETERPRTVLSVNFARYSPVTGYGEGPHIKGTEDAQIIEEQPRSVLTFEPSSGPEHADNLPPSDVKGSRHD